MKAENPVAIVILHTLSGRKWLALSLLIAGSVIMALLPPLVLEAIINRLAESRSVPFLLIIGYFLLLVSAGLLESGREILLSVLGQKVTHALRSRMCAKLCRLPAQAYVDQSPGETVSYFVSDADTVEALFSSGIVSMLVDACRIVCIFAIVAVKNPGLALLLAAVLPAIYLFTHHIRSRTLHAQLENRAAVAQTSGHIPETIRCIRTIHTLGKEEYQCRRYDEFLRRSYRAIAQTNFYDAVYSPVILVVNALIVAVIMLLSAAGNPGINSFFGMSVGTAVAAMNYISQIFSPIEGLGMEIQTIQSAMAGVRRINDFLLQSERPEYPDESAPENTASVAVELQHVRFGYIPDHPVLQDLSLTVPSGEQATLFGRTGSGKSTIFKLLLGLYRPQAGRVLIYGADAATLSDSTRRRLIGYVAQSFHAVAGTVLDQITLFDRLITMDDARSAAQTVGLDSHILSLPHGYLTPYAPELFSQGQQQLLAIARAIASGPCLLLLDEITANLDARTEQVVLSALKNAVKGRTVLSISHRLYTDTGGRQIQIGRT